MNDDELRSLLDGAAGPSPEADAALALVHQRANRRRAARIGAGGGVAVLLVAALALATGSDGDEHVRTLAPGTTAPETTIAVPGSTTTPPTTVLSPSVPVVPGTTASTTGTAKPSTTRPPTTRPTADLCGDNAVRVVIDPNPEGAAGSQIYTVRATNTGAIPCRIIGGFEVELVDGTGAAVAVPGNPAHVSVTEPKATAPGATIDLVLVRWANPCSDGPVRMKAGFLSASKATLDLPQQPCAAGPISTSLLEARQA